MTTRTSMVAVLLLLGLLPLTGACGSSGGGGVGPAPVAGAITVTGRVLAAGLSLFPTFPLEGVPVELEGHGLQFTDSTGGFSFPGVVPPYTAIVINPIANSARIYVGLTRPDPTLIGDAVSGLFYEASIAGTVIGGTGYPEPPNHETDMAVVAAATGVAGFDTADTLTGAFNWPAVRWGTSPTTQVTVHALQQNFNPGTGLPITFTGYGTLAVPIAPFDALVGQLVPMAPIPTSTLSGTFTAPPGFASVGTVVLWQPEPDAFLPIASHTPGVSPFSYNVPDLAGATIVLLTVAATPAPSYTAQAWRTGLTAGAGGVSLTMPLPEDTLLPVDGATGVDTTTDFWMTATANRVRRVQISTLGPGPEFQIFTAGDRVRIPDLSVYGMGLPPAATYEWGVSSRGPLTSVDDLAGPGTTGLGVGSFETSSPLRSFTTAP